MQVLKSSIVIVASVIAFAAPAQALIGNLLPSKPGPKAKGKGQAEVDVVLFDNKKNQTRPKPSHAPKHVKLGEAGYGGSGCPAGTASIVLSTDNRAVSIIFDQFTAEAGLQANAKVSQKNCRLVIPLHAPEGYRMVVAQLDYRGFKSLPQHTHAQLKALHQIRHAVLNVLGPKVRNVENFKGPNADEFYLSATLANTALINATLPLASPITDPVLNPILKTCGGTYNLEIDIELAAKSPQGDQAVLTLDSVDGELKEGVDFHLQWEKCSP